MKHPKLLPLLVLAFFLLACSCLPLGGLSAGTPVAPTGEDSGGQGGGGNSPGYQQASQLAGHWTGTWNNTTFDTTGDIDVTIAVDTHGNATVTVDLGGNVLGVGNVPQLTLPARYDDISLFSDLVELPVFGPTKFNLSWDGTITMGSTTPPGTDILYVSAQGRLSGDEMQITYDIPFKLGSSSSGTATLNRTP